MVLCKTAAYNRKNLDKSKELNQGGVLFGIDDQLNPLVADIGVDPILTDMTYFDTRDAVMNKGGNPTGFEMFRAINPFGDIDSDKYAFQPIAFRKSSEIALYERFTGTPFIGGKGNGQSARSWLESGPANSPGSLERVCAATYPPRNDFYSVDLRETRNRDHATDLGVRRLFRLRKDA